MNRKRCGDADELSYVGYARVNISVFSLVLKERRYIYIYIDVFTEVKLHMCDCMFSLQFRTKYK